MILSPLRNQDGNILRDPACDPGRKFRRIENFPSEPERNAIVDALREDPCLRPTAGMKTVSRIHSRAEGEFRDHLRENLRRRDFEPVLAVSRIEERR